MKTIQTITIISDFYKEQVKNKKELDDLLMHSKIKSWKIDLDNNLIINWKSFDERLYKRIIAEIVL